MMTKDEKLIGIVKRDYSSSWKSCQSIVSNLYSAYKECKEYKIVDFPLCDQEGSPYLDQHIEKIRKLKISLIIFLDHRPHPAELLRRLMLIPFDERPKVVIHLYGDFILDSPKWQSISHLMDQFDIRWICASDAQRYLLDNLLCDHVEVIPFPVDKEKFYYDQDERNHLRSQLRAKYHILPDEKVFIYAGRISAQKNVLDLVKMTARFERLFDKWRLLIAGSFDDIALPYLGMNALAGDYYSLFNKHFFKEKSKRILFLGDLDSESLRKIYCASDVFISLSTHNDEDFGMAPAEALMCGLSCILTSWGGFRSFQKYASSNQCRYVSLDFISNRFVPNIEEASRLMIREMMSSSLSREDRERHSSLISKTLSIEEIGIKINAFLTKFLKDLESPSLGFKPRLRDVAARFRDYPERPFLDENGDIICLYKELYESYGYCNDPK